MIISSELRNLFFLTQEFIFLQCGGVMTLPDGQLSCTIPSPTDSKCNLCSYAKFQFYYIDEYKYAYKEIFACSATYVSYVPETRLMCLCL